MLGGLKVRWNLCLISNTLVSLFVDTEGVINCPFCTVMDNHSELSDVLNFYIVLISLIACLKI